MPNWNLITIRSNMRDRHNIGIFFCEKCGLVFNEGDKCYSHNHRSVIKTYKDYYCIPCYESLWI